MEVLQDKIEGLRVRAAIAAKRELGEWEVDPEDGEGESTEAPCIALTFSLETGRWQALVQYDGGMGSVPLLAGVVSSTPEGAVDSLAAAMGP